jgi:hypothetical protein
MSEGNPAAPATDDKAAQDAAKAKEKADRAAAKAAEKAAKAEAAAKAKAERDSARASEKAAKDKAKADKVAAREQAKKDAEAKREAAKQPESNGVRRPKPDTLCGKAWEIFDKVSAANGAPASIGESMELAKKQKLNEANVRAEYARWRKFHGITGRIEAPKAAEAAPPPPPPPPAPAA